MTVLSAAVGTVIISMEYDPPTGANWVRMWDNPVIGWSVDPGVTEPEPIIIGSLPSKPPHSTDPVFSPQWAAYLAEADVIVPDVWRGNLTAFFDFLATNNGAQRQLEGNFVRDEINGVWVQWRSNNPALVL